MPSYVSAVDGRENSLGAGERAEFFRGQNDASDGRDMAEEDDARAGRDGVVEEIENLGCVFDGAWVA